MTSDGDFWTPEIVQEQLIEAVTWLRYHGGRAGPAGMRLALPAYAASPKERLADHLAEGWGNPEDAEPDDEQFERRTYSPAEIDAMQDRLDWVARYVAPTNQRDAVALQAWVVCRVYRRGLEKGLRPFGISRRHSYRMRDRALAIIARRLQQRGDKP